ncbi:VOC family protein [Arthrobacter flavus]|uniref:VOC family protein n=1 Tax=Arthrobacter flavus TaxID=95172 RepID=A0ABW4QBG0_9MICC
MALDHLGIRVKDLAQSIVFYEQALAPLGYQVLMHSADGCGLGDSAKPDLWLYPGRPPEHDVHVAFSARDRATVESFYVAALPAGAVHRRGPELCPEYHAGCYGAFVTDPDGYNLEAVVHEWGSHR